MELKVSQNETAKDLRELLRNATGGRNLRAIAKSVGIGETTVRSWLDGERLSSVAAFVALVEACGYVLTVRKCPTVAATRPTTRRTGGDAAPG